MSPRSPQRPWTRWRRRPRPPHRARLRRSRLPLLDLLGEASAGLLARPGRMALTAAGTVLGIAALVAIGGLTTTAGSHIVSRFDALAATEVVISPGAPPSQDQPLVNVLPWDAEQRLSRLNGVVAAGTLTPVEIGDELVRTVPVIDPQGQTEFPVDVVAASPGLLGAVRGVIGTGRWFDHGHDQRADRVAVVGRATAERLGLGSLEFQPAVFIGDLGFTVIGVLDDVQRQPALLDTVIIPAGTARASLAVPAPGAVHVHTELGAARVVGGQAALALAPQAPELLAVRVPPEPEEVRATVADDVRSLFLLLAALSLVIGGLGIANTTLVGVLERTAEIGLRRSLGAYRSHIAGQFLVESTTVGAVGGIVGTSIGVQVTVVVSAFQGWTPVMEPWMPVAGVVAGAVIGLAAGTYPGWRAANVQPIAALRTDL